MIAEGDPLARGRTAEIYLWKEGWILKLFYAWFPEGAVRHEARVARAVRAAGLPVPEAGEVVARNGRLGLLYERVEGPSMREEVERKPWTLFRFAHLLAELQAGMHTGGCVYGLPSQRERLEEKIREAKGLDANLKGAVIGALEEMPEEERLCHGDFHPGNVIMAKKGPVIVGWIDATVGNPLADVARSSVIMLGVEAMGDLVSQTMKLLVRSFTRAYERTYLELRPGGEKECEAWFPIVAATRISERIVELEKWLPAQVRAGLRV
jgi:uncharacterized protein (TIGR02172 family)